MGLTNYNGALQKPTNSGFNASTTTCCKLPQKKYSLKREKLLILN